ncbi:thioredoxin-domain-containing protein [Powellomyces hirtus]|nr:thioredoxin-domain-containing protein [Powellomyces hirtus]
MPSVHVSSQKAFSDAINGQKLCVVDFTAAWCGPCKAVAPRFEKLADQYKDVVFLKVDVDENQAIARECGVTAMPTFHIYRAGKKLEEVVGADIVKVERLVRQHASSGGSGGFPSSGGRVLGTGAPAPRSAGGQQGPQSNYLLWGVIGAVVLWLWWNKEDPSHAKL